MKNIKYVKSDLVRKEIARICKVQNGKIQIGDYSYWVEDGKLFEQLNGSSPISYNINE